MPNFSNLCTMLLGALALQLLAVSAVPSETSIEHLRKHHRAVQVPAGNLHPGPVALSKAYTKHGMHLPSAQNNDGPSITRFWKTASMTAAAHVQATNLPINGGYMVNITTGGDNPSNLLVDFDTGSSDFWVFSEKMPQHMRGNHNLYKLGGKLLEGETWNIRYGNGEYANGTIYKDSVSIGTLTTDEQWIEAVESATPGLITDFPADGIIGFAQTREGGPFPEGWFAEGNTCGPTHCLTFMDNIKKTLQQPLFTVLLRHDAPGEFDFGFIDHDKYSGTLTKVPVIQGSGGGYWEMDVSGFSIGHGPLQTWRIDGIADTGTSLCLTDPEIVAQFYAPVEYAHYNETVGGWILPCERGGQLPNLSFWFGEGHPDADHAFVKHTMPGRFAVYAQTTDHPGWCYGGVQENRGSGRTVLGIVFLKSQFVVFDVGMPGHALWRGHSGSSWPEIDNENGTMWWGQQAGVWL